MVESSCSDIYPRALDTAALRAAGSSVVEMAELAIHRPLGVGTEGVFFSGRQGDHGCALSPEEVAGVVALRQL